MTRPAQRRELAEKAVATKGVSIALACRTFGVSETCFRYSPKRDDENEMIADLLVGLTNVHKTWGFGLCFLHLRNVKGHVWNHKRVHRICCELELNLRSEPWNATGPSDHGERRGNGSSARSPGNWQFLKPRTWSGRWTSWPIAWPTDGSSDF